MNLRQFLEVVGETGCGINVFIFGFGNKPTQSVNSGENTRANVLYMTSSFQRENWHLNSDVNGYGNGDGDGEGKCLYLRP